MRSTPIEGVYEYEPFPSYTVAEPGVVEVGSSTNMSLSQSLEGENIEYDTGLLTLSWVPNSSYE